MIEFSKLNAYRAILRMAELRRDPRSVGIISFDNVACKKRQLESLLGQGVYTSSKTRVPRMG